MCSRALYFFILFLSVNSACHATDYFVNDNSIVGDYYCSATGNNLNNGLSASSPKASLTNLLSMYSEILASGKVIYVNTGTYSYFNITLSTNGISIKGAGPIRTIFENNFVNSDANRLLTVTGVNIVLEGVYVTKYIRGTGRASTIQVKEASDLQINNALCNENKQVGGSSTIVINSGSSVYFNERGSSCNATLSIAGGGVNVESNSNCVTFDNYSFSNNSKDYQGGSGLYIVGDNTTTVLVNNSIFSGNLNIGDGGAIFISGSNLNVSNSCFTNNSTFGGSGPKYGGAITVGRGATTVNGCRCLSPDSL